MKRPFGLGWLRGRSAVIGIPYAWLLAFFLLPSRQRLQQLRSAQAPASAAPAGETETAASKA